ncbi:efflux RND transporter periplasmic adaptor subunit [Marinimicrobium sp. ABcell2]|uniref:efflux RND transporter periplasmic adaptor subunit n=1 Tax=Marinimicrobium sp. ABcell2 TaxID=3069751 RepID=UPI0027B16B2D|nr:efflux RND transporter periplasmic adaptor subunit [Marinimicrobium sp. ABcell2]MDQ2076445.1 efflux RND transporter periplasmic adaptor subunit [Marinimicrobium sp. ABcell2]
MTVETSEFLFSIPAKGELVSAQAIDINAPSGNRGTLTLAWLKEENTRVEKGDVVARFDISEHELRQQRAELELEKNQLTESVTERGVERNQFSISQQAGVVSEQKALAERFTIDDLSIYSKNEIIDQLLSKDYLTAQEAYLGWLQVSQMTQGQAQLQLLGLESNTHRDTIRLSEEALAQAEVTAPASGILIHSQNFRGEKVREGQELWPGSRLGSIPSLEQMQARLYILENEAAGVEVGQLVEVHLDAYPGRLLKGTVNAMANIASPRNRNSPTKFFEVTVALEESDPSFMRPGQKLTGRILVAQKSSAISIPNQAVFEDNEEAWVYVKSGRTFKRQEVTVGMRSLTRTEVTQGLNEGDQVALLRPRLDK